MEYIEKTIKSQYMFNGRIINLRVDEVLLPNGKHGKREIVEHNGGVAIVAVKQNKMLLVKQFRKPVEDVLYEIPAGKLEKGEDPYDCAKRELEEETGYIPKDLKLINAIYTSPGFSNEKLYIFLSEELETGKLNRDEDEFLDSDFYSIQEVLDMIKKGTINDAKTICGVLSYTQKLV